MAGVYLSYPFCSQKCNYCNFRSGVFARELERRYVEALCTEVRSYAWPWTPETLYLGGGSPCRMEAKTLARLLALVPGCPWLEATLEAAPGSVTLEKAKQWREMGINRVSLGVQSFVAAELAQTGRKHTAELVAREVELLRRAGIENLNVDLIAGLPGQTAASWSESLDWIARLGVPHVSVYMLEIDEDSRLGREVLRGGARYGAHEMPDEEAVVAFYETAVERLGTLGLRRYEISNFARPGFESRHNLKYWRLEPYVGFGADAHSFDGRTRRRNAEHPAEYVARIEAGLSPCVEESPAVPEEERYYVGLRLLEGVRPDAGGRRRFQAVIRRFSEAGLLEDDGERLRLTPRGILLSNEIFQEFIGA
ncbi:MAG: radical SAM family heme chaperone HemW [Bryobacterales bacterium]|nr:radical SAM family heme chaperone HemW [Bryobacterales bacterium]